MNKTVQNELLLELQRGLPLDPKPFLKLGEKLYMTEKEVISSINAWVKDGTARRLGAIFDARRLGYKSTLCAVAIEPDRMDAVAAKIASHPGITHCYHRGTPDKQNDDLPNLWFTLAVLADQFENNLGIIRNLCKPYELLSLPAVRRFKIDVVFDPAMLEKGESIPNSSPIRSSHSDKSQPHIFTKKEESLVRFLSENIPVVSEPFSVIAQQTGYSTKELLATLSKWQNDGILRRIALVVRHRQVGFKANAMCVWNVDEAEIVASGRNLASNPEVTHCYQRPLHHIFPFNLFAMIHSGSWPDTTLLFERISAKAGLKNGKTLCSLKEYKKTSMQYFSQSDSINLQ